MPFGIIKRMLEHCLLIGQLLFVSFTDKELFFFQVGDLSFKSCNLAIFLLKALGQ